jgi:RNA recognition motif-containing protein
MIKLFVVGFSREMDEIELDEMFSNEGLVQRLTIVRDLQTGISKGYAFVEMMDLAGADRAIAALDGMKLDDRTISVRLAEDKGMKAAVPKNAAETWTGTHPQRKVERNAAGKRPRKIR